MKIEIRGIRGRNKGIMGKAHQRIIREQKKLIDTGGLFGYPLADIKKCFCREISYSTAKEIILQYEWLGTMGTTQKHYGIYFNDVLAGAICFGFFQALEGYSTFVGNKYADKGIQLSRGACSHWAHEHSASKLIGFGLREMAKLGRKYVIAFSDPEAGEIGTVYQATNWHYLGFGKTKHFNLYDKILKKQVASSQDLYKKGTKWENFKISTMDKERYELIEKKAKARYIKLIGTRKENREMMITLTPLILPYPKRKLN